MIKAVTAALALGVAAPALGQTQPPARQPAAESTEPARLAAAQRLLDIMFPEGAMQTMVGGMSDMDWMMDMRVGDFPMPAEARGRIGDPDRSFADVMSERDPHFRERMRITNEVMRSAMFDLFGELEPEFRAMMADVYARRFTASELDQMARFFETPVGGRFVRESLTLMRDPHYVATMQRLAPRIAAAMVPAMEQVRAATAHLPPPPNESGDSDEE